MNSYSNRLSQVLFALFIAAALVPGQAKEEEKFELVCQTWSRPSTFKPLGEKKEIALTISIPKGPVSLLPEDPEEVVASHPDFEVTMSGGKGSASLTVVDTKSGKKVHSFSWQFTETPENLFQGWEQGFTGLIYYENPTTGSEMQMICLAREIK
jgi:hypothetical protein